MSRIFYPAAATAAYLLLVASTGCNHSSTKPEAKDSAESGKPKAADSSSAKPPTKGTDLVKPVVQIETSAGTISVRLDGVAAPGTVRNFVNYVNEGFYDNTVVHYVDPGKMVIAGGYTADRKLKPAHMSIRNEADNGIKNTRGTIAMARDASRIDGATTQFFFNLEDAPKLDHKGDTPADYGYCVFGTVTEGLDVAEKISKSPTTNAGGDLAQTPDPAVLIKSVRVVR